MASMGLDYVNLKSMREDIILCSISALGQTGPLALKPGYDYIAQAYAGITSMIGDPGEPPYIPMAALGDISTGVHAALAVTSALLYKARTGKGQHLDIGLLDAYYRNPAATAELFRNGWLHTGDEGEIDSNSFR